MTARIPPLTRRQLFTTIAAGAVGGGAAGGGFYEYNRRHAQPPRFGTTVAMVSDGHPGSWSSSRRVVEISERHLLHNSSRVLRGREGPKHLRQQDTWLSGLRLPTATGVGSVLPQDFYTEAALDLWVLTHNLPAAVAGWPSAWRYTWPRDTAHVAVALMKIGDHRGTQRQLLALSRLVGRSPSMAARYKPDGGKPDARTDQDDGWGWVLWALSVTRAGWQDSALHARLQGLARHSAEQLLNRVDRKGLPQVSPDYWEVAEDELTLGVAAPSLFGLEHAASLLESNEPIDQQDLAGRCHVAAQRMEKRIHESFGRRGWPREINGDEGDAAVTFMLPPYRKDPIGESSLRLGVSTAANQMQRSNGGYAPGGGWKSDGVAWTPETALLARAWANDPTMVDQSARALKWLADHRTATSSIPEKVWFDGTPAGPAPLAWSASLCLETGVLLNSVERRHG